MPISDRTLPVIVDAAGRPYERDLPFSQQDIEIVFARQRAASALGSSSRAPFRFSSWVYAIVSDIAQTVADIPYALYQASQGTRGKKIGNQNWIPINDDPFLDRLRQPNQYQDGERFISQWITYLLTGGNVWIYPDLPNSMGVPRGLYIFGMDRVRPVRTSALAPPTGWEITGSNGAPFIVDYSDLIHAMMPNDYDQWMGLPPALVLEMQLDADRARVIFDRYFFQNNATPEAVLTYKPGPLNKANRQLLLESWYENHGGPEKSGGLAVIGGDFDLKVLGISHAQAQYLESRKMTAREISSIFHYPVQLLNETESAGLSKDELTVARMMKYENAVFPIASMFARTISNKVIAPSRGWETAMYFDYDGLPVMVDFLNTKMDTLDKMIKAGIPLNEAVRKLDVGVKDVKGGDVGLVADTLVPLTMVEEITKKTLDATVKQMTQPPISAAPNGDKKVLNGDKKAKPASKKSTTQTKAGVRIGLSPMFKIAKRRCKRVLFDMRNDAFSDIASSRPEVLPDATRYLKKITRGILPVCYLSYRLGREYALTGKTQISESISIDKILEFAQKNVSMNLFADCVPQIKESIEQRVREILFAIISDIHSADNSEYAVTQRFAGLYDMARVMAAREILCAFDVGFSSITGQRYFNSPSEEAYETRA